MKNAPEGAFLLAIWRKRRHHQSRNPIRWLLFRFFTFSQSRDGQFQVDVELIKFTLKMHSMLWCRDQSLKHCVPAPLTKGALSHSVVTGVFSRPVRVEHRVAVVADYSPNLLFHGCLMRFRHCSLPRHAAPLIATTLEPPALTVAQ